MKIFVCIKQVPDTETRLKVTSDGKVDLTGAKWIVNPYDEYAIEEAVKTKESLGAGNVTVVCLGPKARAATALRTALAMGCDEALSIDSPEEVDALTTAKALKKAIEMEGGADLIFTGKLAIDDNLSAVSQMLAEFLKVPHVVNAVKFTHSNGTLQIEREVDGGTREMFEATTPLLIGANKGLNKPRFASLPGIMKAKKKPLKEISFGDLGLSADSFKVSFSDFQLPKEKEPCQMLEGDAKSQVQELVKKLREEAKVL